MSLSFNEIASSEKIASARQSLEANGITVQVVNDDEAAKRAVLDLLPKDAEVMTTTSETLETLGLVTAINESGVYDAVRPKLTALMGDPSKKHEQRKLSAAPEYIVGSVHAVTEDGKVLIASSTGSQLPAYSYGAEKVIWVVGAQKIVKDLDEATKRLEEHVFPLEDERAKKAYGSGSGINKKMVVSKETVPGRITMVIVKQKLGF